MHVRNQARYETWAGAIAMQLRYTVTCDPCGMSEDIDMEKMPPDDRALALTFTCGNCGRKGIRPIVTHRSADNAAPRKPVANL